MKDQLRIFRPERVEVEIFGNKHALHRLTRGDVIDLLRKALEIKSDASAAKMTTLLSAGEGLCGELLRISFPTFSEWDNLPFDAELALVDLVWEVNDLQGILENFTKLAGKVGTTVRR